MEQLKNRCYYVGSDEEGNPIYDYTRELPKVNFNGTVKIHGTNASVAERNDIRWFQSRNNLITPDNDNAGFAYFSEQKKDVFTAIFEKIYSEYGKKEDYRYVIFGEWFGNGIQNGVAVCQLSKRFAIFDIVIANDDDSDVYHCPPDFIKEITDEENGIYNIYQFKTFDLEVDPNFPEIAAGIINNLVNEVEEKCPVGEHFGVSGIGEGIVWSLYLDNNSRVLRFKTKGEKHSVTKVRSAKQLVKCTPEEIQSMQDFVEYAVTENRLNQGLQEVCNNSPTNSDIGNFVQWVKNDVIREELDTLVSNNMNIKRIAGLIQEKARKFILDKINNV